MKSYYWLVSIFALLCSVSCLAGCDLFADGKSYPEGDGLLDPYEQAAALARGVNFGDLLEAYPNEGSWTNGLVTEESHFVLAKAAGFDSIRIPIRFSDHASNMMPYAIDGDFFARVDQVIGWGLDNGLRIVIDLHHYLEIQDDPYGHSARFIALWKQVASRYRSYPDTVYFELMNEPNGQLYGEAYNQLIADTLFAIRKIDNHHTVIVSCADWGNPSALSALELPEEERNCIVTFHYYKDIFCFQGEEWAGDQYRTTGITWPGPPAVPVTPAEGVVGYAASWIEAYNTLPSETNPLSAETVHAEIAAAAAWGEAQARPLWMGEFCVHHMTDMASRAGWTGCVREELEAYGIGWSYFSLLSSLATTLYDVDGDVWLVDIMDALGMDTSDLPVLE